METVEAVVFLLVAVIAGGLVVYFLGGFDTAGIERAVRDALSKETRLAGFETVDNKTITPYLFKLWESCARGAMPGNGTIQYEGTPLAAADLAAALERERLCGSLSFCGCGERDDLTLGGERIQDCTAPTIEDGRVYRITCDPQTLTLDIDAEAQELPEPPACADDRENATVCGARACGRWPDACNLLRECGACIDPAACDTAGQCAVSAPAPPSIASVVETDRKLIPVMTSWGTGPIASWGYYSGMYVKGDLLITDESIPANTPINPPGTPGGGCKFGGKCVLAHEQQQIAYTVAFRLTNPLAPSRLSHKLPVDGRYSWAETGGSLVASEVLYSPAGDFIVTNTQQGHALPFAPLLGYNPRPKGLLDPADGPSVNPPSLEGGQQYVYALREVDGRTIAFIRPPGWLTGEVQPAGYACDLTRFRAGNHPADEYGALSCDAPPTGFLKEFFAAGTIVGDEYLYGVKYSALHDGVYDRTLYLYDFRHEQPLDSVALSSSSNDHSKLMTLDHPVGNYVFLYEEFADPPNAYSRIYVYEAEGGKLVPVVTDFKVEGRLIAAMTPIVVDGNVLLLSMGPTLHIYALDDLKSGVVRDLYAGDSTVLQHPGGYFAKKGHYPLIAAYLKDGTAYVYLPARYPSCDGEEPKCIESNLQVWTFGPGSIAWSS